MPYKNKEQIEDYVKKIAKLMDENDIHNLDIAIPFDGIRGVSAVIKHCIVEEEVVWDLQHPLRMKK